MRVAIRLPGRNLIIASPEPEFFAELAGLLEFSETTKGSAEFEVEKTGLFWQLRQASTVVHAAQDLNGILIALYGMIYEWYVPRARHFLLHSGLVARDERAAVICGQQECGKSTLTTVAITQGWHALSDDVAAIDTSALQCFSYPRHLLIRPGTLKLNPYVIDSIEIQRTLDVYGDKAYVSKPRQPSTVSTAPVTAIVFPAWSTRRTRATRLSAGRAAIRLMDNSLNIRHLGYRGVRMATALARGCPAWELEVKEPRDAIQILGELTAA